MSAERVPEQGQQLRFVAAAPEDGISAWLGVLVQLLRVPAGEAEGIREELESHLRERVRDLEVTGMGEEDAVRQAVSELGDAAALAQRYRAARAFPRRRLLMNMSMLAMAGAAVALSVVTLSQPGERTKISVFSPAEPTAVEQAALSRKFESNFQDTAMEDVFKFASSTIGMPINVAWGSMQDKDVHPDTRVTWTGKSDDFRTFMAGLNEQVAGMSDWSLAYRITDGTIKIAAAEYFDRQETVLASYDLSGISEQVDGEQVVQVIQTFVHSPGWVDNGGTAARQSLVGSKLFVEAPKRYHEQIKWFIEELGNEPGQAAADRDATSAEHKLLADQRRALEVRADEDARLQQALAAKRAEEDRAADMIAADRAAQAKRDFDTKAADAARVLEVMKLQHANANEAGRIIRDLHGAQMGNRVNMAIDPNTNSILVSGNQADIDAVRRLVEMLDSRASGERAATAEKDDLREQLNLLQAQLEDYRRRFADEEAARDKANASDPLKPGPAK